jgi:hypothetical protein
VPLAAQSSEEFFSWQGFKEIGLKELSDRFKYSKIDDFCCIFSGFFV